MRAAVRCNALTREKLKAQEKHGKRQDRTSQGRRVRDTAPIVGGGLDLVDLLNAHTEGTKQNKGARNVALHFIIKFPAEVLGDDAPTPFNGLPKRERQREMARQASRFINETHGGKAVFAVRVDTDEAGELVVDVFACPKYMKATKKAETEWTSLTRFGKELARKHQPEIRRRSPKHEGAEPITSPRAVGMSLQSEFASFFERVNGVPLSAKVEKNRPTPDRLEVEEWRLRQMEAEASEAEMTRDKAEAEAEAMTARTKAERDAFRKQARDWVEREKTSIASKHQKADADRALASAELMTVRTVLEKMKDTYQAVRQSLPRIRQILTWDLATETEKRQARQDRKQIVEISPFLRNVIRNAEKQAATVSVPAEKPGPEASGPGF